MKLSIVRACGEHTVREASKLAIANSMLGYRVAVVSTVAILCLAKFFNGINVDVRGFVPNALAILITSVFMEGFSYIIPRITGAATETIMLSGAIIDVDITSAVYSEAVVIFKACVIITSAFLALNCVRQMLHLRRVHALNDRLALAGSLTFLTILTCFAGAFRPNFEKVIPSVFHKCINQ